MPNGSWQQTCRNANMKGGTLYAQCQRMNGGYGKEGTATSDLESTYRVMRAFVMLKSQPKDVEGVRSFVAKCRNADGGYGVSPAEPSNVNATYFAAIIRHWAKDMK